MSLISTQRFSSVRRLYRYSTVGVGLLLTLLVLIVWQQPFVAVEYITRDPAAIADHPIYYGALSNLGILFWSASVAACLVGALVTRALCYRQTIAGFFFSFGGMSAVLCLDDLFLIHEEILPKAFGISEEAMFICYAIALTFMLLRFRQTLLKTQPVLLGASLLLFALSVSSDLIPALTNLPENDVLALEDGSKFMAIFFWFSYFLWATVEKITLLANSLSVRTESADSYSASTVPIETAFSRSSSL